MTSGDLAMTTPAQPTDLVDALVPLPAGSPLADCPNLILSPARRGTDGGEQWPRLDPDRRARAAPRAGHGGRAQVRPSTAPPP